MFNKIPENIKTIGRSTLPLAVIIILFIAVGKFGFSRISELRGRIAQAQRDQTVLTQKLNILKSISETVTSGSPMALTALPSTNPSLITTSQLKSLASIQEVVISGIKGSGEVKDNSGLSRVNISFEATGGRAQIIAFLKSIGTIAPITLVDKVKITEAGGAVRADVSVKSFWAALPTKLPTLTEPITDLTANETETLTAVTGLTQPSLIEIPVSEGGKADPFSP